MQIIHSAGVWVACVLVASLPPRASWLPYPPPSPQRTRLADWSKRVLVPSSTRTRRCVKHLQVCGLYLKPVPPTRDSHLRPFRHGWPTGKIPISCAHTLLSGRVRDSHATTRHDQTRGCETEANASQPFGCVERVDKR